MKNAKPKRVTDEFDGWDFAWNIDSSNVLEEPHEAIQETGEAIAQPVTLQNPIDEDLHADEPVVFGPDGSGEAIDRGIQPYAGAD
jgi:hypothetical protein